MEQMYLIVTEQSLRSKVDRYALCHLVLYTSLCSRYCFALQTSNSWTRIPVLSVSVGSIIHQLKAFF